MALAISQGGTSQTTAEGARIALGLTGVASRIIVGTANQITVTNGDGVAGNPTLSLPTMLTLTDVEITGNLELGGIPDVEAAIIAAGAGITVTGTANEITVTGGGGSTPTISLPTALTFTGKTVTGGTFTGHTDTAVADGGTGASTAANARSNLGLEIGVNVQAFDADLSALAALATNGVIVRTGAGTASIRTITGTANEITVTNGDGVAGNPTLSLPTALTFTGKTITGGTFNGAHNGTTGATTPDTGAFTTISATGLITATGGQIAFPAAQVSSAGANVLDDYEEDVWTPTLNINGVTTGITYTTRTGIYTKIGRLVVASFEILLSNKGAQVGTVTMTGLPFAVAGVSASMVSGRQAAMAFLNDGGGLNGIATGTTITFYVENTGGTGSTAANEGNVTNTTRILGTIIYHAAT